jgi:hypothetical protein
MPINTTTVTITITITPSYMRIVQQHIWYNMSTLRNKTDSHTTK